MPPPSTSTSTLTAAGVPTAFVTGDRDLLFDAVANLVDNAIKHGREAGRVRVEVTRSRERRAPLRSPTTGRAFRTMSASTSSSASIGWSAAGACRETASG